jgi:hypothetical protein
MADHDVGQIGILQTKPKRKSVYFGQIIIEGNSLGEAQDGNEFAPDFSKRISDN